VPVFSPAYVPVFTCSEYYGLHETHWENIFQLFVCRTSLWWPWRRIWSTRSGPIGGTSSCLSLIT
jgi:hypothetical protein